MQRAQQWPMQYHVILLDTTGPTYIFYEIEKKKEKIKEKTTKITTRKEKKKVGAKNRRNNLSWPPPAGQEADT